MALMYDMETVNRAMTEAAKLYDPKRPSIRVKRVLDIFAGMKPVQAVPVVHAVWEYCKYPGGTWWCSNCAGVAYLAIKTPYCPHCGARMDGRVEE